MKRVIRSTEGVVFSVATKTDMAAGLRTLFEQNRLRIPNDKKMIMQINSLRYQVSKTGNLLFESLEVLEEELAALYRTLEECTHRM